MVGIAWTGISFGWLPDVINFTLYLTGNQFLPDLIYLIIALGFLPFFAFLWLVALTKLINFSKPKLLLAGFLIFAIFLNVIFFILLFTDTDYIGTKVGPFHYDFSYFTDIFSISLLLVILITGIKFALESFKSDEKALKLKGKFLILAFILFTAGAVFETLFSADLTEVTVVLVRILLISSSITFYLGFILPDWVKKLLLSKEK